MSQQIMITITDTLVKLIIMILKAKEKIREVEYFDLELECRQRIMVENQIFTRQVVQNWRGGGSEFGLDRSGDVQFAVWVPPPAAGVTWYLAASNVRVGNLVQKSAIFYTKWNKWNKRCKKAPIFTPFCLHQISAWSKEPGSSGAGRKAWPSAAL